MLTQEIVKALPALAAIDQQNEAGMMDWRAVATDMADELLFLQNEVGEMARRAAAPPFKRERDALDEAFGREQYEIHMTTSQVDGGMNYAVTVGVEYASTGYWMPTLEAAAVACIRRHAKHKRTVKPEHTATGLDEIADELAGDSDTVLAGCCEECDGCPDTAIMEQTC